ncbi:MAG: hypothetical protein QXP91_00455 [Candidatus Methanomethylicia archaeon]
MKEERFKLLYQTFHRILDEEYGKVKDDFGGLEIDAWNIIFTSEEPRLKTVP